MSSFHLAIDRLETHTAQIHERSTVDLGALVVFAALTFNAVLAFVNAHLLALTPSVVIGAEILIIGTAHLLAAARFRDEMKPWYGLIILLALFALFRAFGSGNPDLKSFRDALIIPTFILLGLTVRTRSLVNVTVIVQAITLLFLMLEALNTNAFSSLFEIKSYYINTRGVSEDSFWNTESNLFVSATRPDERFFFPAINLHRASSIFLEPVSLGNYCVVVNVIIISLWSAISPARRWFLFVANVFLIIGCDGRLAFLSSLLVCATALASRYIPPYGEVLYLPTALTLGFIATVFGGWHTGSDDIPGRVALTIDLLQRFSLVDYLGLSSEFLSQAVDSGLVYMIATQTVFGVVAIWFLVSVASSHTRYDQVRYLHGAYIFIASNFLVSFSFLSIKTAALLWGVLGSLQFDPKHTSSFDETGAGVDGGTRDTNRQIEEG